MSDIDDTIARYNSVCKQEGVTPSPFILKILQKDKEQCGVAEEENQMKGSSSLYLAGNNTMVTDTRLGNEDARMLYHTLKNNFYVTGLDLRYNNITDEGAVYIGKLMEENSALQEINIMCNDFEEEGAKHIAKALHENESLTSLRLNGNKIGNNGGMYFAQALQINVTLESLDLGDTDLKTGSVIALATVLVYNKTLKALNVNRPILFSHQEETTDHFGRMLKVNRTLTELHLMKYDMRDFGVTRLAENLMDNFTLTYLNLNCNRITRDGMKELSKLLKQDTPLEVLDLGFNRASDDGACYLAEALATYNTHLTTLVLVSNEVSGRGLCAIADCMKMNTTLSKIYIWGNDLEESVCIAFSHLIDTGRLELMDTDVKPYTVDGVTHLSELSHGERKWYYWGPSYGDQALPELAALRP